MNKRRIAFIVEGENREQQIFGNIQKNFFKHQEQLEVLALSAGQNIYMLAKKMQKDPDMDMIEVLRESSEAVRKQLAGLTRNSFQEIYLFFDYDGHANNISDEEERKKALENMLSVFDNETEQGKLYISYPMVEALRDITPPEKPCYERCSEDMRLPGIQTYKNCSAANPEFLHVKKYEWDSWKRVLYYFGQRVGCLLSVDTTVMNHKEFVRCIDTARIYEAQYTQFMMPYQRIFILSAFPQFLLEYFKEEYWHKNKDTACISAGTAV